MLAILERSNAVIRETGWPTPHDDITALDRQAAHRMGRLDRAAIRKLAVERFDASRMVDAYLGIFERAAGRDGQ